MNENINLCEILKDCPRGIKLWDDKFEEVIFSGFIGGDKPISVVIDEGVGAFYTEEGYRNPSDTKCVLWPSKNCRDWSKWKCPKPKFDPKTLKPFDKVLVRTEGYNLWSIDLFSFIGDKDFKCIGGYFKRCIPYNEDTKHLIGTTEEAPEYYRYWKN